MYGSCRIIRSSVILTALFKWSFGVIFREFKTVTGSIVTFGVEVELGVNLRQIYERYYTVISIKITAEYGASINQPWAQDHAALARADSLPS